VAKLHFLWALLALSPLAFAEPAETPKNVGPAVLASDYVMRELGSRLVIKQGKTIQPEKASKNIYTPEQMAAVRTVFGSENPLLVKREPASGGRSNYSITLPAGQFQDEAGQSKWAQASMKLGVAPNGSLMSSASLSSLSIVDKQLRLDMEGMSSTGSMAPDYWSSKSHGEIRKMRFVPAGDDVEEFSFDGIRFSNEFERKGRYFTGLSEFTFGRIGTEDLAVDKLHLALRWRKLDAGAMTNLKVELDRMRVEGTDESKASQSLARYLPLLKRLVLLGASVDIEDLSASYNGQKVAIKGRLSMPNATKADFESGSAAFKKLAGQLEIAVPLSLLREAANAMARNDKSRDAAKMTVEQLSAETYEILLGKALANNYARLEKDTLRTKIELKGGLLAINGTNVPLEPLMALFEDEKLPPADTEPPVAINMRDRGLEAAQLFALNGNGYGLLEMCERTADGVGIEKDPQRALDWCTKAFKKYQHSAAIPLGKFYLDGQLDDAGIPAMVQQAADESEESEAQYLMYRLHSEGKGVARNRKKAAIYLELSARQGNANAVKAMAETDAGYQPPSSKPSGASKKNPWSFSESVEGGYFVKHEFRFDKEKHRRLTVSMDNLQPNKDWIPLLSVCVSAINPSDITCVNLHGNLGETPSIEVVSDLRGAESKKRTNDKWHETVYKPGDKFDVMVYVSDNQVHFVVNGDDSLVQQVNFPVEVISLNCSTADCKFDFQH